MPIYEVTDPNSGKTLELEGDTPPTEQELNDIFSSVNTGGTLPEQAQAQPKAQPTDSVDWQGYMSEVIKNAPGSAARYAENVTAPIHSPVQTGTGLANLASGMITKGAAHILPVPEERLQEEDVQTYEAAKQAIIDRYGGLENLKKTVKEDPIGFLGDVSSVLIGGGAATKAAGLTRTGKALTNVAQAVDPLTIASAPVRAAAKIKNKLIPQVTPEQEALIQLSKEYEVPLSYSDITQSPAAQKIETSLEYAPGVGQAKFRMNQGKAADAAIREVVNEGKIPDWQGEIKGSLDRKYADISKGVRQRYDKVTELAEDLGSVPATEMNKTAYQLLKDEMQLTGPYRDAEMIKLLQGYTVRPKTSWSGLQKIRENLQAQISDYYSGANKITGSKGVEKLAQLKKAIEKDMETAAMNSGNKALVDAYKDARKYYQDNKAPYKELTDIRRALDKTTPEDEIYSMFVKKGKEGRAERFYNALDNRGQDAVRQGILVTAMQKAEGKNGLSPAKFAKYIEDQQSATGVFFKGRKKTELDGFVNLMKHAERGGQVLENPPTGARVLTPAITGAAGYGIAVNPAAVAGAFTTAKGLQLLFTTERGKNFLLRASQTKPGSNYLNKLIATQGARLAGEVENISENPGSRKIESPSLVSSAEASPLSEASGAESAIRKRNREMEEAANEPSTVPIPKARTAAQQPEEYVRPRKVKQMTDGTWKRWDDYNQSWVKMSPGEVQKYEQTQGAI